MNVDSQKNANTRARRPVAALILAAGGASRLGRSKPLLAWGEDSLLRHVARVALSSPCDRVHAVLGSDLDETRGELADLDVTIIEHDGWRDGMGSSLAAGIAAIEAAAPSEGWEGVLVMLCDQPFVTPELVANMLALHRGGDRPIVSCRYQNTLGPPAFFDASFFDRLIALSGDQGARRILEEHPEEVTSLAFPNGELDIDTEEDYEFALEKLRADQARSDDEADLDALDV